MGSVSMGLGMSLETAWPFSVMTQAALSHACFTEHPLKMRRPRYHQKRLARQLV